MENIIIKIAQAIMGLGIFGLKVLLIFLILFAIYIATGINLLNPIKRIIKKILFD